MGGEIDSLNAEEFQAQLNQNIKTYESRAVVLDFGPLSYISSAGLRAILLVAKILHAKGRSFALCSLSETVNAMVKTAGFDKVIDVYESRSEAVSATST